MQSYPGCTTTTTPSSSSSFPLPHPLPWSSHPYVYNSTSTTPLRPLSTLPSLLSQITTGHLPKTATVQSSDSHSSDPYVVSLPVHLVSSHNGDTESYMFGYTYSPQWLAFLSGYDLYDFLEDAPALGFNGLASEKWDKVTPSLGFSGERAFVCRAHPTNAFSVATLPLTPPPPSLTHTQVKATASISTRTAPPTPRSSSA